MFGNKRYKKLEERVFQLEITRPTHIDTSDKFLDWDKNNCESHNALSRRIDILESISKRMKKICFKKTR